jgi:hypothetical protein
MSKKAGLAPKKWKGEKVFSYLDNIGDYWRKG